MNPSKQIKSNLNCKFCKQEFRPFKNESVLSIADFKQAEIDLINKEDRTCSICLKLCQDKASRKSHQKRTHGQSSCSKCNQTFTSQGKLKYHKTTVHAVTKKETKETLHVLMKCINAMIAENNLTRIIIYWGIWKKFITSLI